MISAHCLAIAVTWVVLATPVSSAPDLSRYRQFQLGMSLVAVAQQAGITPEPRVRHQPPHLIQELMWMPSRASGSSPPESVRKVLFSFYNGQLFRMAVTYDRERTEGLTADDMVDAISATYGVATLPATAGILSWAPVPYASETVLAQWDDAAYALALRSPYVSTFGLVVSSKQLEALARAAAAESIRLDTQEVPQREIERQQRPSEENRVKQATARRVNKPTFRP